MVRDRATAIWVSHSSISDFLACPRAYYLKNIYKNPKTGNKIQIITPPLALGQVIHNVVESLSVLQTDRRFETPLVDRYEESWKNVTGKLGGFSSKETEQQYRKRGEEMIRRIIRNPGPISQLAVKIQMDLPYYWLSDEDNIILCGKIDWLEYLPDEKSVHIIDFKTGKSSERDDSLQLPIYCLLVEHTQKYPVSKASYWYLENDDKPQEQEIPDLQIAHKEILKIAKKIKLARQLDSFKCPQGESGCRECRPFEAIVEGKGELVGTGEYGNDIYVLEREDDSQREGEIL